MSIYLKNEIVWDFANYHYYNVWAFLNNRLNWDIVPATFTTFLNPFIDFPLYFYIQWFNNYPDLIWGLQGIWGGLLLFYVYKTYALFFDFDQLQHWIVFGVLCVVILTGWGTISQWGSSANEIPVAFFILWGFYLLLKMIKYPEKQQFINFFIAGFIMGIALGFKQTVITYCVASGATLIICYKYFSKPLKNISFFVLGGLIGYLIINGYFMYKYWILYQNPMFPFLNGVFHSPYFDNLNYYDNIYPPSWKNFIFFPFQWFQNPHRISTEYYSDIHLTLFYITVMLILASLNFKNIRKKFLQDKMKVFLLIFFFISFYFWLFEFAFLRYAVVLEVIGAIILAVWVVYLFPKKTISFIFCSVFAIIFADVLYENFYSDFSTIKIIETDKKRLYVEPINLPENTLVKIYGMPGASLIPFFEKGDKSVRAVGHEQYFAEGSDFAERGAFRAMRDEVEKKHKGMTVFLFYKYPKKRYISEIREFFSSADLLELIKPESLEEYCINGADKIVRCANWPTLWKALKEEMGDKYFCKMLDTNMLKKGMYICVPKGTEKQIFENIEKTYE